MAYKQRNRDEAKEKFWRAAFVRYDKSGLSAKDFCAQEKLNPNTFSYWRCEIKKRDQGQAEKRSKEKSVLVPVSVTEPPAFASPDAIEICTADGVTIRVPLSCSANVVGELVSSLRGR